MTPVEAGEPAPDPVVRELSGDEVRLSSAWQEGRAALVFLRYFGCPFCQSQVVGLREDPRITGAGMSVSLIGHPDPDRGRAFVADHQLPFRLLLDNDRSTYRAYGLVQARLTQVLGPQVALPWIKANLTGKKAAKPQGRQLHADAGHVRDRCGRHRPSGHRNRHVADNPTNEALLEAAVGSTAR